MRPAHLQVLLYCAAGIVLCGPHFSKDGWTHRSQCYIGGWLVHRPLILRLCLKSNRHKQSQLPPQMRKLHHIPATGCNTSNTSSVRSQRRGAPNTLPTLSYLAPQFVCPTTEPFETSQSLFKQTCEQLSAQGTRQLHSQPSERGCTHSPLGKSGCTHSPLGGRGGCTHSPLGGRRRCTHSPRPLRLLGASWN